MSDENCALCGHFKMKEHPEHAKVGLGRCAGLGISPINEIKPFLPWSRPACERYVLAPNMVDRQAWIDKRRALDQKNNAGQSKSKG